MEGNLKYKLGQKITFLRVAGKMHISRVYKKASFSNTKHSKINENVRIG